MVLDHLPLDHLPDIDWRFLALLGLVLLANPVYAYPAGVTGQFVYDAERVDISEPREPGLTLVRAGNVVQCPADRECVLEGRIRENGSVTTEDAADVGRDGRYRVVFFDEGYYAPTATSEGDLDGSVTYGHEPLSEREALARTALDTDTLGHASPTARRAVDHGTVVTDGPVPEATRNLVVRDDGNYYTVELRRYDRNGTARWDGVAARLAGFGGGALLLLGARRRRR
jgi:hypothetical protein